MFARPGPEVEAEWSASISLAMATQTVALQSKPRSRRFFFGARFGWCRFVWFRGSPSWFDRLTRSTKPHETTRTQIGKIRRMT